MMHVLVSDLHTCAKGTVRHQCLDLTLVQSSGYRLRHSGSLGWRCCERTLHVQEAWHGALVGSPWNIWERIERHKACLGFGYTMWRQSHSYGDYRVLVATIDLLWRPSLSFLSPQTCSNLFAHLTLRLRSQVSGARWCVPPDDGSRNAWTSTISLRPSMPEHVKYVSICLLMFSLVVPGRTLFRDRAFTSAWLATTSLAPTPSL